MTDSSEKTTLASNERLSQIREHDFPILLEFHSKHALGPLTRPSCLVCGRVPEQWPPAIQHAELPGIVVCHPCRDRATHATLAPSSNGNNALPVGAEDDPLLVWVLERYENCIRIAAQKKGQDRDGWLEDATHFQAVLKRLAAHGNETCDGWLPMATAPQGGKWLQLWWPEITDCALIGYRGPYGWHCPIGSGYTEGESYGKPQFWRALPESPMQAARDGKETRPSREDPIELLTVARACLPDPDFVPTEEEEIKLRSIRDRIDTYLRPSQKALPVDDLLCRIRRELARGHSSAALAVVAAALEHRALPVCSACDVVTLTQNAQSEGDQR